jgi:ribose-phosphate pyrophosphokinase
MLFCFDEFRGMADTLRRSEVLRECSFTIAHFDNWETHINISKPVKDKRCFILGSIAPPDSQLISVTMLAHTLKQQGAECVTAILPYLAYARQDKIKAGESLAAAWAGSLLWASGVDQIVTIDVHSDADKELFTLPMTTLSPAMLFAAEIETHSLADGTIVAPDRGALPRCEALKQATGVQGTTTPRFDKKRT